jgi:hypothetical protein
MSQHLVYSAFRAPYQLVKTAAASDATRKTLVLQNCNEHFFLSDYESSIIYVT